MNDKKTRILIAKLGLDGHDRGAKLVARSLRDAGAEVTYLGIRHRLEEALDAAIEGKVDYIGLSFLAGDHLTVVPRVIEGLKQNQAGHIRIIVGGIIPAEDVQHLLELGVDRVFLPGTPMTEITNYVTGNAA